MTVFTDDDLVVKFLGINSTFKVPRERALNLDFRLYFFIPVQIAQVVPPLTGQHEQSDKNKEVQP